MKRTPPWVFVAGAAVQLAAIWLCTWAMERCRRDQAEPPEPVAPGPEAAPAKPEAAPAKPVVPEPAATEHVVPPSPPREAPAPAREAPPAPQHAAGPVPPPPAPEPARPPQPDTPPASPAVPEFAPAPEFASAPPVPRFGPPPVRAERPAAVSAAPHFVVDEADEGTQVLHGRVGEGSLVIGIASDGNIRCVDIDGARYTGKAESARARLREVDGPRAFTVQIGVDAGGALHASFTGGAHDGETIGLTVLVEGSVS